MKTVAKILVDVSAQTLFCLDERNNVTQDYAISTAKNGVGQRINSECTPLGRHVVRAKIGASQPVNTVFRGRRPSGEIYTAELGEQFPDRDWILTRILWLSGCESGHNRLGDVDTMRRFIYIHGAPDEHSMGVPSSHGCIKMRNADVLGLYQATPVGARVDIVA